MNFIVLGRSSIVKRMDSVMNNLGIRIINITGGIDAIYNTYKYEWDTMAFVDCNSEDAESTCLYINKMWRIPICLLIDGQKPNWQKLDSFNCSGYIDLTIGNDELGARLNSMIRRICPSLFNTGNSIFNKAITNYWLPENDENNILRTGEMAEGNAR